MDAATVCICQGDRNLKLAYRHGHTVQRVHDDAWEKSPLPGSNRGSLHTDDSDVTVNAPGPNHVFRPDCNR